MTVIWQNIISKLSTKSAIFLTKVVVTSQIKDRTLRPTLSNANKLGEVQDSKWIALSLKIIILIRYWLQRAKRRPASNNNWKSITHLQTNRHLRTSSLSRNPIRSEDTKVQKIVRISNSVSLSSRNHKQRFRWRVRTPPTTYCQRVTAISQLPFWGPLTTSTKSRLLKKRISTRTRSTHWLRLRWLNWLRIAIRHCKWRNQWKCLVWTTRSHTIRIKK